MEFPSLGQHCTASLCGTLDFLPMKCDACNQIFCKSHIFYKDHGCSSGYKRDIQVPVCPLCNKPVPVNRDEVPDVKVGQHIDRDCQSDPAKAKRKVYTNPCSVKGCKKRELVRVTCSDCKQMFCLTHRHGTDHDCPGKPARGANPSRLLQEPSAQPKPAATANVVNSHPNHGSMSDDEALAVALQLSLNENHVVAAGTSQKPLTQEESDFALAQALAKSEQEFFQTQQRQMRTDERKKSNCAVS